MVKFSYFDRTDVSITWQPWDVSTVTDSTMTVLFCAKLRFIGWLAHAGATPEIGRSALDAMELMTVGANYISGNTWWSRAGCTMSSPTGAKCPASSPPRPRFGTSAARRVAMIYSPCGCVWTKWPRRVMMTETEASMQLLGGYYDTLPNKGWIGSSLWTWGPSQEPFLSSKSSPKGGHPARKQRIFINMVI